MNTIKSDNFIKEWSATPNPLQRKSFESQRDFTTTPVVLFPLLCPTTELDWLPRWNCELLHSESGFMELNCIFKTTYFGVAEVWVCTRYDLNKAIECTRYAEDHCIKFEIRLTANPDDTVTGHWTVTASALNDSGNMMIKQLTGARKHLELAIDALGHYVDTGEMIPSPAHQ